jgi:hypothetical protein
MEPHQGNTTKTLILDSVLIETDADRTQGSVKRLHRIHDSKSRMRETRLSGSEGGRADNRSVYPTVAGAPSGLFFRMRLPQLSGRLLGG